MTDWMVLIGLWLACAAGIVLAMFRLPGTWLILAAAAGYAWYTQGHEISWFTVGVLAGLAVVGEIVELCASLWTARRGGASRRAAWCGLIGGVAGMLAFSIPVPVIGTILGGALGCLIGAVVGELSEHDDVARGVRVGLFASIGLALGAVAKLMVALIMAGLTAATSIAP